MIISNQRDFFDFAVQCATSMEKISKAGSVGIVSFNGPVSKMHYQLTLNDTSPELIKVGMQSRFIIINPRIANQYSELFISYIIVWGFVRPDCSSDINQGNIEADEIAFDVLHLYQPDIDIDLLKDDFKKFLFFDKKGEVYKIMQQRYSALDKHIQDKINGAEPG